MSRRFNVSNTLLAGVRVVEREIVADRRGFLSRLFCADELADAGWVLPIAQINQTFTAKQGTVRGLHFQTAPHAEMKLVMCLQGEVFDVAIDLRRRSPTLRGWHGEYLSASNNRALLIPEGCAHGFQALSADVVLLYLHSHVYVREAESAFSPLEPRLAIVWPCAITEMSDRDANHPPMHETFDGVNL
jgi:dTDP-4-dehydrorhamnose 3,5-epimerase